MLVRFCHILDFIATSMAASTFRLGRIIPYEVLFSTKRLISVPSPEKRGGLNGSMQHLLEVFLWESTRLITFASVDLKRTLPCLGFN